MLVQTSAPPRNCQSGLLFPSVSLEIFVAKQGCCRHLARLKVPEQLVIGLLLVCVQGAPSVFHLQLTIMPESAHGPSDSSRRVTIANLVGERLVGIIDDTGSNDLVVLCHGFRSTKNDRTLNFIIPTLIKSGTSTFRFDFSGNGESEGSFDYGNYWKEVEDLRAVILHWRAEGREVNTIIGHSKGGDVVLLYASRYGELNAVVNMSGRFALKVGPMARFGEQGMKKLEEEGYLDVTNKLGVVEYAVTLEGLRDRLATDIDSAICGISKDIRVLTIHGSKDEVVPVKDAYEFDKRIANHVLRIIRDGNHTFEGKQKELAALVIDFLQGRLPKHSKI